MTQTGEISSADWAVMLDSTAGAPGVGYGEIVTGVDDVAQCIAIIVSSPPGCDPMRPDFALDLSEFVDIPISAAIPAIVAAVTEAISRFEPRVKLRGVTVKIDPSNPGHVTINVHWTLTLDSETAPVRTTSVAAALATGYARAA